jgi:hypothetical protein
MALPAVLLAPVPMVRLASPSRVLAAALTAPLAPTVSACAGIGCADGSMCAAGARTNGTDCTSLGLHTPRTPPLVSLGTPVSHLPATTAPPTAPAASAATARLGCTDSATCAGGTCTDVTDCLACADGSTCSASGLCGNGQACVGTTSTGGCADGTACTRNYRGNGSTYAGIDCTDGPACSTAGICSDGSGCSGLGCSDSSVCVTGSCTDGCGC